MSKIGIHFILMVYFFSLTLDPVQAISNTKASPQKEPRRLQKIFPSLRNQKLTNNMLSLIHNWRREEINKRRLNRIKRKGAFVVTDLEGNPMLVVRKQKIKQPPNYPKQQPTIYDLQNLGLLPSGSVLQNLPKPPNMLHLPPYEENQNLPQQINIPLHSDVYDEYNDDFDLIPLAPIKSVKKKYVSTEISTISATSPKLTTLQIPEPPKLINERETKELDKTKGVVNLVSLLASALEEAFSVPHGVVLPNAKRESTSPLNIPLLQDILIKRASTTSSSVDIPILTSEQISPPNLEKVIRELINSSLEPTSITPDDNLVNPKTNSILSQIFPIPTPILVKHYESPEDKSWKDFRLMFAGSKIHGKATPAPRNVIQQDILSLLPIESSSSRTTTEDINSFWEDTPKSKVVKKRPTNPPQRYKLQDDDIPCTRTPPCQIPPPTPDTLNKILEVVEDIQVEAQKIKAKEDLPCKITGSWSSIAGGMLIHVEFCNDTLSLYTHPKTPAAKKGIIIEDGWEFKVFKPFSKQEMIIANGLNEKCKRVVSFVGECKICGGIESITGDWLVGRPSSNCKDQKAAEILYTDVWTRERLSESQRKKLRSAKEKAIQRAQEKKAKSAPPTYF